MENIVIKVENISKAYQIGQIGTGTISRDLERFWIKNVLKKEDPFLKIGELNDRSIKGQSDIVWSLKDINFNINQGEAVGIIGKNGAGKSTLLKILSRVTSPTVGEVKVKGRIASLLEVGTGFHPELSGRENIFLNGAILGMRKKEISRKLDEIIDFSGVERYVDTPVKRYSSGMYVRLAFAVAAHLESEILIVDEVLAVGDADFQKKCLGKMGEISKGEGRTVLFVSHNMSAVSNLCNTSIFLENGTVRMIGQTNDIITEYIENKDTASDFQNSFKKRKGDGELRIESFNLLNGQGVKSNNYFSGDKMFIQVRFSKSLENKELSSIYLIIEFSNQFGKKIFSVSNRYCLNVSHDKIDVFEGLTCEIPNLSLTEGNYTVDYWLSYKSGHSDEVREVTNFNVLSNDYYNTGYMPEGRKHGEFLIDQNWIMF